MKTAYVYVRLGGFKCAWRMVRAESLSHALQVAYAMPDVLVVLEASWVSGGVAA